MSVIRCNNNNNNNNNNNDNNNNKVLVRLNMCVASVASWSLRTL